MLPGQIPGGVLATSQGMDIAQQGEPQDKHGHAFASSQGIGVSVATFNIGAHEGPSFPTKQKHACTSHLSAAAVRLAKAGAFTVSVDRT